MFSLWWMQPKEEKSDPVFNVNDSPLERNFKTEVKQKRQKISSCKQLSNCDINSQTTEEIKVDSQTVDGKRDWCKISYFHMPEATGVKLHTSRTKYCSDNDIIRKNNFQKSFCTTNTIKQGNAKVAGNHNEFTKGSEQTVTNNQFNSSNSPYFACQRNRISSRYSNIFAINSIYTTIIIVETLLTNDQQKQPFLQLESIFLQFFLIISELKLLML